MAPEKKKSDQFDGVSFGYFEIIGKCFKGPMVQLINRDLFNWLLASKWPILKVRKVLLLELNFLFRASCPFLSWESELQTDPKMWTSEKFKGEESKSITMLAKSIGSALLNLNF